MTPAEIELSKKLLHTQSELLRMKLRMDAMEAVIEAMAAGRRPGQGKGGPVVINAMDSKSMEQYFNDKSV